MLSTPEHVQPIQQGCRLQSFSQVEFTQPLGVGLGLAVRINNQYSHPVCTGRHMDAYTTINDMWEISQKTGYLHSSMYAGIWEFVGMGYHVDNVQKMPSVKSQLMMSWGSHTK